METVSDNRHIIIKTVAYLVYQYDELKYCPIFRKHIHLIIALQVHKRITKNPDVIYPIDPFHLLLLGLLSPSREAINWGHVNAPTFPISMTFDKKKFLLLTTFIFRLFQSSTLCKCRITPELATLSSYQDNWKLFCFSVIIRTSESKIQLFFSYTRNI